MAKGREPSNGQDAAAAQLRADVAAEVEALLPSDKLYYRIGEVSELTGVKTYVLRYWESEFRGMVPQKSRSKQRLYKRRDIEMILLIKKLLYEERYTIAGARLRIKELGGAKNAPEPAPEPPKTSPIAAAADKAAKVAKGDAPRPAQPLRPGQPDVDHRAEYARIKQSLVDLRALL